MLLLVWSTFCNQFATGVFAKVTHESMIFVAFINVALYGFMSLVCVSIARFPWLALNRGIGEERELPGLTQFRLWLGDVRFDRKETAAICFCGAAKGGFT
jgi:sodium/bile acid cotransporter 7